MNHCLDGRQARELDLQHDEVDRGRKLDRPVPVLWGTNTAKRSGWQTSGKLDFVETWRERAHRVLNRISARNCLIIRVKSRRHGRDRAP